MYSLYAFFPTLFIYFCTVHFYFIWIIVIACVFIDKDSQTVQEQLHSESLLRLWRTGAELHGFHYEEDGELLATIWLMELLSF